MAGLQKQWPKYGMGNSKKNLGEINRKALARHIDRANQGLIRGAATITFENDHTNILNSMIIWAIWKSRNKNTINDQDVAPGEASSTLKDLIRDLMRKSWNATCFLEGSRRTIRQRALRALWADGHLIDYDPKIGPAIDRL